MESLSAAELEKLEELLRRVVEAGLEAPEPPGATHLKNSRKLAPGDNAHHLAKIDQYLDDLKAFRDDAHLAAFQPHEGSGHAWEAFTMLWREKIDPPTAAQLAEKLTARGYETADYATALSNLAKRGWLVEKDGSYTLTETGREIRRDAETLTDRYFYAPWTTLNHVETAELRDLLTRLETSVAQAAEAEPA